jgi:hypothetical protein
VGVRVSPPAPSLVSQLNYSIDLQAYYLQQSMWVDNMVDKSCASYLYQKRGLPAITPNLWELIPF